MLRKYICLLRDKMIQQKNIKFGFLRALCNNVSKHPTAGIIVIGDEILNAQVKDVNSNYICHLLYQCGVRVKKISVIEDDVEGISREMQKFSEQFTHVITSGGIGPTHDDVTFEALAKAFDKSLHYDPELVDIIRNKFGARDPDSPALKLAFIPEGVTLEFGTSQDTGERLSYPCVKLKNVYVFPGSPHFLRASFGSLYKKLFGSNHNYVSTELYMNAIEESFANALTTVSQEFPAVKFGSYPQNNQSCYKARVTMVCDDSNEMERAKKRFESLIPPDILIDHHEIPLKKANLELRNFVRDCERYVLYLNTIEALREMYKDPKSVAIYFDASDESVALLHLAQITKVSEGENFTAQLLKVNSEDEKSERRLEAAKKRYRVDCATLQDSLMITTRKHEVKTVLSTVISGDESRKKLHQSLHGLNLQHPLINWTRQDVQYFVQLFSLSFDDQ